MNKFQMSMVKKGEQDVAKFDKQIADLEQKAIKAVLPIKEKMDALKLQRAGLIEYLEKFKTFMPDNEPTEELPVDEQGINPINTFSENNPFVD